VFYGLEFAGKFSVFDNENGSLDWNLFADYVRAERANGDNLPRISPARLGTGLDYTYNRFGAGVDLTNILAQNDNAVLETDTGGYTLLNLNANYALYEGDRSLDVFMRANNLLDEDGAMHTSFIKNRAPIMGQSLMVGFQAGF
jgi:iron complex outermembrane receptor protein